MIKLTMNGFEVPEQDGIMLRRFIEQAVGNELGGMAKDCYYPRVSSLFKELMHRTGTNEKMLIAYTKKRYPQYKFHLLHNPYTTLLILIVQYFLNVKKDEIGARWTFNLFAIRTYSNLMFKYIRLGCNPSYWKAAMEMLSHSHLFRVKKTVGNSILYLSQAVYDRYRDDMIKDRALPIMMMIMLIRSRIEQSMRSFYRHYYQSKENKETIQSKEQEKDYGDQQSLETKVRLFADKVSKDLCVYGKINQKAIDEAATLTKFNRRLCEEYSKSLRNPDYAQKVEEIYVLLFRGLESMDEVCTVKFIDHVKRLMSVKTSLKPVYFKKSVVELHDGHIIPGLGLQKWFNGLSIQTRKVSRDYLAYYLAFFIRTYLC